VLQVGRGGGGGGIKVLLALQCTQLRAGVREKMLFDPLAIRAV